MHTMQYEIGLPADYDMGVIRHRVATRGSGTDSWPGLGAKAYLIRERGVDGSPRNSYAPFYVWNTVEGMNEFLWGAAFRGILTDFGRPVVRQWTGLAFHRGPTFADQPDLATKLTTTLTPDADPAAAIAEAAQQIAVQATAHGLHSVSLAIDTSRWQLVRFALWQRDAWTNARARLAEDQAAGPAAGDGPGGSDPEVYTVLHLSRPEVEQIATGRH